MNARGRTRISDAPDKVNTIMYEKGRGRPRRAKICTICGSGAAFTLTCVISVANAPGPRQQHYSKSVDYCGRCFDWLVRVAQVAGLHLRAQEPPGEAITVQDDGNHTNRDRNFVNKIAGRLAAACTERTQGYSIADCLSRTTTIQPSKTWTTRT